MAELEEQESLFDPSQATDMQTILLMRIYDVLIADFCVRYPAEGSKLQAKHAEGGLVGAVLSFNPEKMLQE